MAKNPERFIPQSKLTEFDVTRAKILIGDFLARFDIPCTPDALREILTVNETVIAYFTYVEAYEQMLANAMLTLDEKGFVTLTETGRQLVSELSDLAQQRLRDKALESGEGYFRDRKTQRDTDVRLVEKDGMFGAQCECFDNGMTLMRVTLFYSEKELADYMRSLMNADPVGLYCKVFDRILRVTLDLEEFAPQSPMDKNLLDGVLNFLAENSEFNNKCVSKALDKGFEVTCKCTGEQPLMELSVFAQDENQAEYICEKLSQDKLIFSIVTRLVLQNSAKQESM